MKNPQLVIWVFSAPANFERRNVIRNTWGKSTLYLPINVVVVFSLGLTSNSKAQQQQLTNEQSQHNDLVQDAQFVDHYRNLTYKVRT